MKVLLSIVCFTLAIFIQTGSAQCDPSPFDGVHVVKKGETLFALARQYNLSVQELCTWNNWGVNEPLTICQELVVSPTLVNPQPANYSMEFTEKGGEQVVIAKAQPGNWHTVRWGETVASIAEAYGYTEARFRRFNKISNGKRLNPGAVVKSTDCFCGTKTEDGVAVATTTGNTGMGTTAGGGIPTGTMTTGSPVPATTPTTPTTPTAPAPVTSATTAPSGSRNFMTTEESSMIDEINLMRSNPAGYVKYVREYVKEFEEGWGMSISPSVVSSLIRDLETAGTLSQLRAHECLYDVAEVHGKYLASSGQFKHSDASGAGPYTRTKNGCPQVEMSTSKGRSGMLIGNENLVGGHSTVRQSVIDLLLDEGVNPPGHRETLLAPEWQYVACFNFGDMGMIQNNWVQLFGR